MEEKKLYYILEKLDSFMRNYPDFKTSDFAVVMCSMIAFLHIAEERSFEEYREFMEQNVEYNKKFFNNVHVLIKVLEKT